MANFPKTAHGIDQPGGFSRVGVLIAGVTSLLIAVALFFAWQDRILAHLHFASAETEILKVELQGPYSEFRIHPAPATKSMPGGVILRLED